MRHDLIRIYTLLLLSGLFLPLLRTRAEVIDRVVAVVNGRVLTQLSLEKDQLMREILSGPTVSAAVGVEAQKNDQKSLELIIDQSLIREQMMQYSSVEISAVEVESETERLTKDWGGKETFESALKTRHFTLDEMKSRIRWQLEVLKFIDSRFRQFTVVEPKEISDYYQQVFLPAVIQSKLTAPAQAEVEDKIRALLAEEKVNQQLEEWLKSLRQVSSIQIMK